MARTTSVGSTSVRRVTGAVGAAALAWVGVVGTDIPASVVTTSTTVHVSSTPAVPTAAATTSGGSAAERRGRSGGTATPPDAADAVARTPVTTVVAEAGAASPVHVSGLA